MFQLGKVCVVVEVIVDDLVECSYRSLVEVVENAQVLKTGFRGCSDFGFGSYGTWLQLMCCMGLVVCPYISEYPKVRDGWICL